MSGGRTTQRAIALAAVGCAALGFAFGGAAPDTGDAVDSMFETFFGQNTGQFIGVVSDRPVIGDSAAVTEIAPASGALLLILTGPAALGAARWRFPAMR